MIENAIQQHQNTHSSQTAWHIHQYRSGVKQTAINIKELQLCKVCSLSRTLKLI